MRKISYVEMCELFRRIKVCKSSQKDFDRLKDSLVRLDSMATSVEVAEYCRKLIRQDEQEELHILSFNSRSMCPLEDVMLMKGTSDLVIGSAHHVLQTVMKSGGDSYIIWHTHPGKDCTPSPADCSFTSIVALFSNTYGVKMYDSIILPTRSPDFYSFRDANIMKEIEDRMPYYEKAILDLGDTIYTERFGKDGFNEYQKI